MQYNYSQGAILKRKAEKYLKEWANRENRKPLVIRGARQVGKSYLVKKFAKQENYKRNYSGAVISCI